MALPSTISQFFLATLLSSPTHPPLKSEKYPGISQETFPSRHPRTKKPGAQLSAGDDLSTGLTFPFHR